MQVLATILLRNEEGNRMGSQCRHLAILIVATSLVAIGLACASAEECDYKACGALMARDGSVWAVLGHHGYSPETKRACAELNACIRRAKSASGGRAATAPAAGSSSSESSPNGPATVFSSEPADKPQRRQPASNSAVHETSGNDVPNADRSNGKPTPCFAVAEILVPVDCTTSGRQ
jgi:hypothetical protein